MKTLKILKINPLTLARDHNPWSLDSQKCPRLSAYRRISVGYMYSQIKGAYILATRQKCLVASFAVTAELGDLQRLD